MSQLEAREGGKAALTATSVIFGSHLHPYLMGAVYTLDSKLLAPDF